MSRIVHDLGPLGKSQHSAPVDFVWSCVSPHRIDAIKGLGLTWFLAVSIQKC